MKKILFFTVLLYSVVAKLYAQTCNTCQDGIIAQCPTGTPHDVRNVYMCFRDVPTLGFAEGTDCDLAITNNRQVSFRPHKDVLIHKEVKIILPILSGKSIRIAQNSSVSNGTALLSMGQPQTLTFTLLPGFNTFDYMICDGAGLLNAGKALRMIEKPLSNLYHFGSNANSSISQSLEATDIPIQLTEHYENAAGVTFAPQTDYLVNKYKVQTLLTHQILPNEKIVSSWARSSSSTVVEDIDIPIKGKLRPRERAILTWINNTTCKMEGYVYEVFDTDHDFIGWLPFDIADFQSEAKFEYSVLTSRTTDAQEMVLGDTKISLYPNPASDIQQIKVNSKDNKDLTITLLDIQGRRLKDVFKGIVTDTETLIENNVETLPNGLYIYEIKLDKTISYSKFIKQ
jgi:Secretion system C-terminal sorting domain